MKVKFLFGAMVSGLLGASVWISGALAQTDPLPSWNDGANKQAIVEFVEAVTSEGGADFVAPGERIATFDNDGTLWSSIPCTPSLLSRSTG